MRWTDTFEIARELADAYPDTDPLSVRFTDLMQWVLQLPGFEDAEANCSEGILEAIQMAWLDER